MSALAAGSLRALARPHAARGAVTLVVLVGMSFLSVAYPFFSGRLVDSVVHRDASAALLNGAALTGFAILTTVAWSFSQRSLVRLLAKLADDVRRAVFAKFAAADLAAVAAVSDARARTRVDADVKALTDSLEGFVAPGATALVQLLALLAAVAAIDVRLLGAILLSLVPLYVLGRFSARTTRETVEATAAATDRFAASVATYLSFGGILRARAFGRTARDGAAFDADALALRTATVRFNDRSTTRILLTMSASALVAFAILVVGIELVVNGQLSVGALVAFIGYQQMISGPMARLARAPQQLAALRVTVGRIDQMLALPDVRGGDRRPPGRTISLRDVTYRYPDGTIGIEHVSLDIRRDEKIAIIGPSGSGKSTLAMVIQALYVPEAGEVSFDGVPAQACDRAHLRELFAYDGVGAAFVPGTIRENIAYAAPDDDPAHCAAAARDAQAAEFIEALPDGYETRLDDGEHGFSTGQLRRLGIARALAAKRPFLVLDEPTGPLDPVSGGALFAHLLSADAGCVVATHELDELDGFDRVVVMANNTITHEMHADLLREGVR